MVACGRTRKAFIQGRRLSYIQGFEHCRDGLSQGWRFHGFRGTIHNTHEPIRWMLNLTPWVSRSCFNLAQHERLFCIPACRILVQSMPLQPE